VVGSWTPSAAGEPPRAPLQLSGLQGNVIVDNFGFAGRPYSPRTHDIDCCGIERVLDVSGVEFLDHLNAGAAVSQGLRVRLNP
jgi:hypothetical protein